MDRVIVTAGTKTPLYQLFEDLQNYEKTNVVDWLFSMIDSFGVIVETTPDGTISSSDTSLLATYYDSSSIQVAAGAAITASYDYINVPTSIVSTSSLLDGTHILYLQHTYVQDTPVPVQSGFAYGLGLTANSREHDSYQFVWDVNPLVSGITICQVYIYPNGIISSPTSVIDLRSTNMLKFSPALVHTQNTDTGTTSPTFRIGNSAQGSEDGALVALVAATPSNPLNFRIVDVTPSTQYNYIDEDWANNNFSQSLLAGPEAPTCNVLLKWNYDDIQGIGGTPSTGYFTITNTGSRYVWTAEQLVGYHLWLTGLGLDYVIVFNAATNVAAGTTALVVTPYGTNTTIIDGLKATGSQPAWIHNDADAYELVFTPVEPTGVSIPNTGTEQIVRQSTSGITAMQYNAILPFGQHTSLQIRASKGAWTSSTYVTMVAGTYTKQEPGWITVSNYTSPFLVQLPNISSAGAGINLAQTLNGFSYTIAGWTPATAFELCYAPGTGTAAFSSSTSQTFSTVSRTGTVNTSAGGTYSVLVQPIVTGQIVAPPLSQIVSAGGGTTTTAGNNVVFQANLQTFKGTLGTNGGPPNYYYSVTSSNLQTPADTSGVSTVSLPTANRANPPIITVAGSGNFTISAALSAPSDVVLFSLVEDGIHDLQGSTFTINTGGTTSTLPPRLIGTHVFTGGGLVTLTAVNISWSALGTNANPNATIRYYQQGQANLGVVTQLTNPNSVTAGNSLITTPLILNPSLGPLVLVIDAYDPQGNNNLVNFIGTITVYYS